MGGMGRGIKLKLCLEGFCFSNLSLTLLYFKRVSLTPPSTSFLDTYTPGFLNKVRSLYFSPGLRSNMHGLHWNENREFHFHDFIFLCRGPLLIVGVTSLFFNKHLLLVKMFLHSHAGYVYCSTFADCFSIDFVFSFVFEICFTSSNEEFGSLGVLRSGFLGTTFYEETYLMGTITKKQ